MPSLARHFVGNLSGKEIESLKPGPWGDMVRVPIEIAPVAESMSVRAWTDMQTKWSFEGRDRPHLENFLRTLNIAPRLLAQMLDTEHVKPSSHGMDMFPTDEVVFGLSASARLAIYKVLAGSPLNADFLKAVPQEDVVHLFERWGVTKSAIKRFTSVSCPYKNNLICYAFPAVLRSISSYEDRVNLMRAVYRQKTMLLRLHITPESNCERLNEYWSRAIGSMDTKILLESLIRTQLDTWLNVVLLLPPLPSALLYSYPPPEEATNAVPKDCYWTSFNFFHYPPDNNFSIPSYIVAKVDSDYYPINNDPHFGDILFFTTPQNKGIHSAVFIADNIVFTKNGIGALNPWMLDTIEHLTDLYSFSLPEGQSVKVCYYRRKNH